MLAVGDIAGGRIQRFLLEEEDRIVVANGSGEQSFDIGRGRRRHDFDSGNRHSPVLDRLGMLRAEPRAAAIGRAHHQRHVHLATGHIAGFRHLIDDDVPAHGEEIGKHDLGDRPQTGHRRAHSRTENGLLGDRGVAHPHRTEFVEQPDRGFEHTACRADIFAEENDVLVALHFLRDAGGNRFAIS